MNASHNHFSSERKYFAGIVFILLFSFSFFNAQEQLRPLNGNINLLYGDLYKNASDNKQMQSKAGSLSIPFKDDFYYATSSSYPDQNLWEGKSVYVNTGHGIAPPSIGVATFDGLNEKGFPWQPALVNMNNTFPSDTLTSKPINMLTLGAQTLQPTDSVALSFYYQARGNGDAPESIDSLLVDFYIPSQSGWKNVWFSRGNSNPNTNDTIFKRGFIWLDSSYYFADGFRFRFRNKATNGGDFDHWHIDYVYLNKGRSMLADTLYDDMSFGYVPTPLLARYSSMPWEQYTPGERANNQSVFIRNNNGINIPNMTYESRLFDPMNVLTYSYTGGAVNNLKPFKTDGWSSAAPHAYPAFTHTFGTFTDSASYKMQHVIYRSGNTSDFFPNNDTVIHYQRFKNYFAFDDGSAEAAYYVSGGNVQILQKITLNLADTFQALRIYFDPIGSVISATTSYNFNILVYNEVNGLPFNKVFEDSVFLPKYLQARPDAIADYTLHGNAFLQPGNYFIGIKQKVANVQIGIGFDRNLNHSSSLYFTNGSGWVQSTIPGSLMMRPVFGAKDLSASVPEMSLAATHHQAVVYPNPASNELFVNCKTDTKLSYQVLNTLGQLVAEDQLEKNAHEINTSDLNSGVYLLILRSGNQIVQSQKIVIQK